MLALRKLLAFQQVSQRTISTASRRQIQNRVPEHQRLFQEDDGVPVHLKGGRADGVLYRVTMTLCALGGLYAFYELGVAAMPKKAN